MLTLGFIAVASGNYVQADAPGDVILLKPFVVEAHAPKAKAHPIPLYGDALLRTWVPPDYPKDALREYLAGTVTLRLAIDEKGTVVSTRVLDATDPRFIGAAQEAAMNWLFSPALEESKPISSSLDVSVIFSPDNPHFKGAAPDFPPQDQVEYNRPPIVEAKLISAPDIDYPDSLFDRKLSGWAHFSCTVRPDGTTANSRILAATHVDFVFPALRALERLKYSPRMFGDTPIEAEVEGELKFDLFLKDQAGVLAANNITAPDGSAPSAELEPSIVIDPIFPYDRLIKGEGGSATVSFTVDESGSPLDVRPIAASDISFGNALVAAMEMFKFAPPGLNGHSVRVQLRRREVFIPVDTASVADTDQRKRLLTALLSNQVRGGQGLDEALTPLYRVSPRYPAMAVSAGRPPGEAVVEFIVDRFGRAQFPRVVSATKEEFGWSAATAAGQWIFKVPLRMKQPVDVKVRMSFLFRAPTK